MLSTAEQNDRAFVQDIPDKRCSIIEELRAGLSRILE